MPVTQKGPQLLKLSRRVQEGQRPANKPAQGSALGKTVVGRVSPNGAAQWTSISDIPFVDLDMNVVLFGNAMVLNRRGGGNGWEGGGECHAESRRSRRGRGDLGNARGLMRISNHSLAPSVTWLNTTLK